MSDRKRSRFNYSVRFIIGALVAVLIFGYAVYSRLVSHGTDHSQINILVPWGLIAIFISFYLFGEFNRVRRAKRDERREYLNDRRQEIIDNVIKSKSREPEKKKD